MEYPTDLEEEFRCCTYIYSKGFTKLMHMVMNIQKYQNYVELREYIKGHPEEIDKQNAKGFTALMLSTTNMNKGSTFETFEILVNSKCNLDLQTIDGITALMMACFSFDIDVNIRMVQLLVDFGCNVNMTIKMNDTTALIYACRDIKNSREVIKILINAGCNLDIKDAIGWSPLLYATRSNDSEIVKLMIDAKYDQYIKTCDNGTKLVTKHRYMLTTLQRFNCIFCSNELYILGLFKRTLVDAEIKLND